MHVQVSQDHESWRNKYGLLMDRIAWRLGEVVPSAEYFTYDYIFVKKEHLKRKNSLFVVIMYDNISQFYHRLRDAATLTEELRRNNNYLIIITGTVFANTTKLDFAYDQNIRILRVPEMCGIYYLENYTVPKIQNYSKTYSAFNQRGQYNRLDLFLRLAHEELLDAGYVSYLSENRMAGHDSEQTDTARFEYAQTTFGYLPVGRGAPAHYRTELLKLIPFRNYKEPINMHDLEKECQYSIVIETYDQYQDLIYHGLSTEKTFRALISPTTPIFFNTAIALNELKQLGFQFKIDTSHLQTLREKIDFAFEIIKNPGSPNTSESIQIAEANNNRLKYFHDIVMHEDYAVTVVDRIIKMQLPVGW